METCKRDIRKGADPMRRLLVAVLVWATALVAVAQIGAADVSEVEVDATPNTCDERTVVWHHKQARQTIKAGWSLDNWKGGPKRAQGRAVKQHIACLDRRKDRDKIKVLVDRAGERLRRYRDYREVATVKCLGGRFGYFAIPCSVVSCESGYSWSAENPSGARGPYQFLGWSVPWPVRSFAHKLAHHRMAAYLWADSPSHWAQCL